MPKIFNMIKINYILIYGVLISFILFAISGCTKDADTTNRNYELVWEDNFQGSSGELPDATKWTFDIGTGQNGWGNRELQYYTNAPTNVSLDGEGMLAIVARSESFGGKNYTSARIKTQEIFDQAYGRFEARAKLPRGFGLWPAFWLLGSDIETVGWPQCGEIDIMENRGQEPTLVQGTVHGPGYSGGGSITSSFVLENSRFDVDFHVFAIEWGLDFIDFYVDDNLYQRIAPEDVPGEWVYDHPFFMILNVAVGGDYVGSPNSDTKFPQTLLVDYVRVYKEVN
ncbi:MAG: glycoside hydrolase family 16 protein [Chitinophagales bacterium]